jgi:hypothetical protein
MPDFLSNEPPIFHSLACAGMVRQPHCCSGLSFRFGSKNHEPRCIRVGGLPNEFSAGRACEPGGDLPALDRVRLGLRACDRTSSAPWRKAWFFFDEVSARVFFTVETTAHPSFSLGGATARPHANGT